MGTNTAAPTGFVLSRQRRNASPTYQGNLYTIKKAYASSIGRGDLVQTDTSGNAGYVKICGDTPTAILGVFNTILPYYDLTLQGMSSGLNGSWVANANSQGDVQCLIFDDPDDLFRVQATGGTWAQSWRGSNIPLVAGTNGVPNASGISVAAVNGAAVATTNSLPLRIQDVVGVTGGPQDPANANPWIEVSFNFATSEFQQATGI